MLGGTGNVTLIVSDVTTGRCDGVRSAVSGFDGSDFGDRVVPLIGSNFFGEWMGTLMNESCIEVGRMAWSRARGDSRSLPYSVQSDLPYAQDTDAIRLGSKFPCGDTGRRV